MPNVPNTPMLSKSGELHAGGHISLRGNASVNTAYAVSDHFGLMLNGSRMNNERNRQSFKHNLLEMGIGYFDTFGADNTRILEIYAGAGMGNSDRNYQIRNQQDALDWDRQEYLFSKTFLQVNFSSSQKKSLRLFQTNFPLNYGTALRISHVNMTSFVRNDVKQLTEDNIFLEPVFFTRMALSPTVQIQYTSGSNFGLKSRKFLTAGNSIFTLGLVVNVGNR